MSAVQFMLCINLYEGKRIVMNNMLTITETYLFKTKGSLVEVEGLMLANDSNRIYSSGLFFSEDRAFALDSIKIKIRFEEMFLCYRIFLYLSKC